MAFVIRMPSCNSSSHTSPGRMPAALLAASALAAAELAGLEREPEPRVLWALATVPLDSGRAGEGSGAAEARCGEAPAGAWTEAEPTNAVDPNPIHPITASTTIAPTRIFELTFFPPRSRNSHDHRNEGVGWAPPRALQECFVKQQG